MGMEQHIPKSMTFYNEKEQLYPDTDILGSGLGESLPQARNRMQFPRNEAPDNIALQPTALASKSLISTENCYSNIEREVLGILHGLEYFHHYHFASEVNMITDHKQLVPILKKDVAGLSQSLQRILLYTPVQHQNTIKTRATNIHCRLVIQAQPWNKYRWRNTKLAHNP